MGVDDGCRGDDVSRDEPAVMTAMEGWSEVLLENKWRQKIGPHYSSDCQTWNSLVYEPNTCNNYDLPHFDQPPQYHIDQSPPQDLEFERLSKIKIDRLREDVLSTQIPNLAFDIDTEESDDDTEVIFDNELFLREHTLLMGDEAISTTPVRENNEFIKSSVDDLVLIPWESEVTLVSTYLECSMPIDSPPLPCIDVLGDA
nr:hypothetical protein [Tanacetum cinerariifolium]